MTKEERELALYCLKASSDYHSEVCEECINYSNCDHTIQDDVTETIIKALEQESVLDKIRAEIVDSLYVDSLIFGELIDFKNGKISADDVIEEFNRVTRTEVLKILDKYKAESEDKGLRSYLLLGIIDKEEEEW